ncbi:MAG: hypothetical protein HY699_21140 [Deltaproteobacteria bacterium]|nr:hypothetical protein [Deltaproteobacteria bacterium]
MQTEFKHILRNPDDCRPEADMSDLSKMMEYLKKNHPTNIRKTLNTFVIRPEGGGPGGEGGSTTRLVFVKNEWTQPAQDRPEATLGGTLVYQRKLPHGGWEDVDDKKISGLKAGEGFKIELHSGELRTFYEYMRSEYGDAGAVKLGAALMALAWIPTGHHFANA